MFRFLLTLACGSAAFAQQYTITTVGGGAPPPTPVTATATSIGQPNRTATDSAGNIYFSAANTIFRMSTAGVLTVVAGSSRAGFSGDGGPAVRAQLYNPQGIAFDGAGNMYIADAGNNRVRIVSAQGIINTFAGNGQISAGGSPSAFNDGGPATNAYLHLPSGVSVDRSGNVYIADTSDNLIRKVATDGIITSVAGNSFPSYSGNGGQAVNAELNKPGDVLVDSSGNLLIADTSNGVVRKVATDGIISTIAGTGAVGSAGDGQQANTASITGPLALALDSAGNLYIMETNRVRKVDTRGIITTVAGNGTAGFSGDGSAADRAQLNYATGVAVDSANNLYIADSLNLRLRKVTGGNISTVAGNGKLAYSGDGGPATSAQMNSPQGTAVDAAGNIYVAETDNQIVRRIAANGGITTFAGNGTPGFGGDGGAAASAQLNSPVGVAVDAAGNVYIADSQNARVRRVAPNGTISTVAGNGTQGFGGDGGAATSAQLYTPTGVGLDAAGNLYIADFNNNRVRRVSTSGTITTVAGNGNSGFSGDGGPATSAQLNLPRSVALDTTGTLYIADSGNNRIRQVSPNGQISTFAGNGQSGSGGPESGPAIQARLGNVAGVAVDATGNVYLADGASRIRKVYAGGFISTIAGSGQTGYSGDGGPALSAQLAVPSGIAVDAAGNAYIGDTANNAVRALQAAGFALTISSVTNGASNLGGAIAPGEVVVIYGSGLGPATPVQGTANAAGIVPATLGGVTVSFNDATAPLLYVSASQLTAIVPYGVTGGTARVFVQYQGQVSNTVNVSVAPSSPAIFTLNSSGSGQALAINPDRSINDAAHPARAGEIVLLYATGEGQTNPPGQNGKLGAIPLPAPVLPVTVTVGGMPVTPQYAGGAVGIVAGVMQLNILIPSGLAAGPVPIVLQVGPNRSPDNVTIYVAGN